MNVNSLYFMRDQVSNVVPSLMKKEQRLFKKESKRKLELTVFVITALSYLIVLIGVN